MPPVPAIDAAPVVPVVVPVVVAAFAPADAVAVVPEVAPLIAAVAAPKFATAEVLEVLDLVVDPVVGLLVGLVAGTIVTPVDDDPLPGDGKLVFAAERVTGALVGEDGWLTTALTMSSPNCSVVVSRPSVSMGSSKACVRGAGCCPRTPAAA